MNMAARLLVVLGCVIYVAAAATASRSRVDEMDPSQSPEGLPAANSFEECLRKDSITCVQLHAFRSIRSFFVQETVRLGAGLELVRDGKGSGERSSRALEEMSLPEGVEEREEALEAYAVDSAVRFLEERSLRWNPKEGAAMLQGVVASARAVANVIVSSGVGAKIGDFIAQGRGKKILKAVVPILVGIKIKVVILMVLVYFAIALIAKKAILASLVSLVISAVIGIRKLLDRQQYYHHPHHVSTHHISAGHADYGGHHISPHVGGHVVTGGAYYGGSGPSYSSGYDGDHYSSGEYAAHSSPVAHALAYGGQKPGLR